MARLATQLIVAGKPPDDLADIAPLLSPNRAGLS
jgi:hypothetical protein